MFSNNLNACFCLYYAFATTVTSVPQGLELGPKLQKWEKQLHFCVLVSKCFCRWVVRFFLEAHNDTSPDKWASMPKIAQHDSLIPNRNSQASGPLIKAIKGSLKKNTKRRKQLSTRDTSAKMAANGFKSMTAPTRVSGWCGNGFESRSQPFLLTYPKLIKSYMTFCLLFFIWVV